VIDPNEVHQLQDPTQALHPKAVAVSRQSRPIVEWVTPALPGLAKIIWWHPGNHRQRLAVYTGTHDNNTLQGWWALRDPATKHNALVYLNSDGTEIHWDFIRGALASVAAFAVFPMQDVLGLGPEACMNRPGTSEGNWLWRYREEMVTDVAAERLRVLSRIYGRLPYPT
jgi:4-alpha-glucanotransferase